MVARVTASVASLAIAPVKGMQVAAVDAVELEERGPVGDRAFLVVDRDDGLLPTTRTPALLAVEPAWDGATLRLRFPDGSEVAEEPRAGAAATTHLYDGREMPGRLVDGALADALSEHLGRPVLRVVDAIPRCVVTTRDPDAGRTDLPILKALARLRGKDDVTFGVWCEVARPGAVRRGDAVTPA